MLINNWFARSGCYTKYCCYRSYIIRHYWSLLIKIVQPQGRSETHFRLVTFCDKHSYKRVCIYSSDWCKDYRCLVKLRVQVLVQENKSQPCKALDSIQNFTISLRDLASPRWIASQGCASNHTHPFTVSCRDCPYAIGSTGLHGTWNCTTFYLTWPLSVMRDQKETIEPQTSGLSAACSTVMFASGAEVVNKQK